MRMWFGAALAGALMTAIPAQAAVTVLFLGADDQGIVDAARTDILGSDARFDLVNSASYSGYNPAPTLGYLQQFNSVLVWSNASFNTGYSQLLADYANSGGGVVISTFWGQINGEAGGLNAPGLNPLTTPSGDAYSPRSLGTYDAASPFMQGVTMLDSRVFNGDYSPGLDAGAKLVASWDDGTPLVAVNGAGNVANVTLFPSVTEYGHATGDYQLLFRNALFNVANPGVSAAPEPAAWGMMILGFGVAGGALRRTRRVRATRVTFG